MKRKKEDGKLILKLERSNLLSPRAYLYPSIHPKSSRKPFFRSAMPAALGT
jgi:hypothetical protein